MMIKLRAVVMVVAAVLLAGVLGGSERASYPAPDRRDAFHVSWRDGAKYLRVQTAGPHYAIVTLSQARIVDGRHVTERTPSGEIVREREVYLVGDEIGLALAATELPADAWWDNVLGIRRGMPGPKTLVPALKMPTAEDHR